MSRFDFRQDITQLHDTLKEQRREQMSSTRRQFYPIDRMKNNTNRCIIRQRHYTGAKSNGEDSHRARSLTTRKP
jgi:hypothetical protein